MHTIFHQYRVLNKGISEDLYLSTRTWKMTLFIFYKLLFPEFLYCWNALILAIIPEAKGLFAVHLVSNPAHYAHYQIRPYTHKLLKISRN
jgi:hypothetical protein